MAPGYAPIAPYYQPAVPVRVRRSRPWQLVVGAILAMLSAIALLTVLVLVNVASRSVIVVLLAYIPASALVLAPVFMLMGYRWAYSLTVSGLAGLVMAVVIFLLPSEVLLLPVFVLVAVFLALVLAPVWVSLWLLLTRRAEEVFEGPRKRQLTVYYRNGEEEPYMQDPKEIPAHTIVYVPTAPSYGYAGYGGYHPGYGPYPYGSYPYGPGPYGSYGYGSYGTQIPGSYYPGYPPPAPPQA